MIILYYADVQQQNFIKMIKFYSESELWRLSLSLASRWFFLLLMWLDLTSVESFFSPFLLRSDERLLFLLSTSVDLDLRRLPLSLDLLRFLGATTFSLDLLLLAFLLTGDGLEALRAAHAFKSAGMDPRLPSLSDSLSFDFLLWSWKIIMRVPAPHTVLYFPFFSFKRAALIIPLYCCF